MQTLYAGQRWLNNLFEISLLLFIALLFLALVLLTIGYITYALAAFGLAIAAMLITTAVDARQRGVVGNHCHHSPKPSSLV